MPLVGLSAIEEMLITAVLPAWQSNVPSFWHALKYRRQSSAANRRDARALGCGPVVVFY
jgi:hypothetical protein